MLPSVTKSRVRTLAPETPQMPKPRGIAVHPVARLLFRARTNAEAFGKTQQWVSAYNVVLLDVSWDYASDEPEPITLSIYFQFDTRETRPRRPQQLRALRGDGMADRCPRQ